MESSDDEGSFNDAASMVSDISEVHISALGCIIYKYTYTNTQFMVPA